MEKRCCFVTCVNIECARVLLGGLVYVAGHKVKVGWGKVEIGVCFFD